MDGSGNYLNPSDPPAGQTVTLIQHSVRYTALQSEQVWAGCVHYVGPQITAFASVREGWGVCLRSLALSPRGNEWDLVTGGLREEWLQKKRANGLEPGPKIEPPPLPAQCGTERYKVWRLNPSEPLTGRAIILTKRSEVVILVERWRNHNPSKAVILYELFPQENIFPA